MDTTGRCIIEIDIPLFSLEYEVMIRHGFFTTGILRRARFWVRCGCSQDVVFLVVTHTDSGKASKKASVQAVTIQHSKEPET
jgi:hypothetical protein